MIEEIDPVFHTPTLVSLLRAQGLANPAKELLERLLKNNPNDSRLLLLKEEKKDLQTLSTQENAHVH